MRAKKLPSGSWRVQVYKDGVRRSFTVDDPSPAGKRECERQAAAWAASACVQAHQTTVKQAIDNYIDHRAKSLSVTTLAAYKSMAAHAYGDIDGLYLDKLTQPRLQAWMDAFKAKHSPKTCANAYALLSSALAAAGSQRIPVVLPAKQPPDPYTPTDADVQKILQAADGDLRKAIMLAAFGTLRKGEVCALTRDDIDGTDVHVRRSMAWNGSGYVIKSPKTPGSVRTVALPAAVAAFIVDGVAPGERIIGCTPAALASRFRRLVKASGVPHFRFHDLRAYSASIRHALGIPDQYIMADGGWKSDSVMKRIYRRAMDDKRKAFSDRASAHFTALLEQKSVCNFVCNSSKK